jgi:hemoglobin
MWTHAEANQKHGLTTERFEHWLSHWFGTVDSLFVGENATFVKNKALEIGQILDSKFNNSQMYHGIASRVLLAGSRDAIP